MTRPTVAEIEAAGGFPIIYADPPWSYKQGGRGAARNHYATLTTAQILALPVSRLAAKSAVLFLWATWPNLPAALATIAAWGFEFKTLGFLWVKHYAKSGKPFWGGGFWTRANSEFCLLGVRGDIGRVSASVHQLCEEFAGDEVCNAPPTEHSAKPVEVRERITQLVGDLPRIELFARERIPGWEAWGNEVESDIAMNVSEAMQNQQPGDVK